MQLLAEHWSGSHRWIAEDSNRQTAFSRTFSSLREVRRFNWITGFWQDVRCAFRKLFRHRGFAAVAVLSLALGIRATVPSFPSSTACSCGCFVIGTPAACQSATCISSRSPWDRRTIFPLAPAFLPNRFESMTFGEGEEIYPNLSPDGKQFIYASSARGHWDIYLQRAGGSAAIDLTADSAELWRLSASLSNDPVTRQCKLVYLGENSAENPSA
jgi:hypothetical protein